MRPITVLLAAATLGGVWAACEHHSRQTAPLLVTTAEPRPSVYVWPEQRVQLHCRPSQPGGCRWMKGSTQLGTDCQLSTTERGIIKCLRGEEASGSIQLNNPRTQEVETDEYKTTTTQERRYDYGYTRYVDVEKRTQVKWPYNGQKYWNKKSSTFLCSDTGTIILKDKVCDGTKHCGNSDDEWNCKPPCGPPLVRKHSALSSTPLDAYSDGSEVTFVCQAGFSFSETLSGLNRTCRAGRWTAPPPVCRRNVALRRPVSVTGVAMADCRTAVDGLLDTWCMLAPSGKQQSVAVRQEKNVTVSKVLVRALSNRYNVKLRAVNQTSDELTCSCEESNDGEIHPALSGVRVCSCPDGQADGERELVVRAESGAFMSLSVAEIVALQASDGDAYADECTLLGHPAHGQFEPAGSGEVKLSCKPGHRPSCFAAVRCSAVRGGEVRLSCLSVNCPQPAAIPHTEISYTNGTGWQAVAEYACVTGYALYPAEQNTTAVCGTDGLWSIGHVSCLPETDIRVVAMRLGQQHERSITALREELRTELEGLLAGQQQLLAQQSSTQRRLSKLERDVSLLGLAEGAHLQMEVTAAGLEQLEKDAAELVVEELEAQAGLTQQLEAENELTQQLEAETEQTQQEAAAKLEQQLEAAAELEQQLEAAAELEELEEGAAELGQLEAAADVTQLEAEAELA